MARIVGRFIQSLQKPVAFRRVNPVSIEKGTGRGDSIDVISGSDWTSYADATKVQAVVLPRVYRAHAGVMIEDDNQFTANLTPPQTELQVGDELVRSGEAIGKDDEQKLTILNIQILRDIQQLRLENRDEVLA